MRPCCLFISSITRDSQPELRDWPWPKAFASLRPRQFLSLELTCGRPAGAALREPFMPDPVKVFQVERLGHTVVVLPQGPALQFQHNEVHVESNALLRVIEEPVFKNVIVDLHCVDYVDSVIISSILRCLTKIKQKGGKSVFCAASQNMRSLLKSIQLGRLWPEFPTREAALEYLAAPPVTPTPPAS